MTILDFRPQLRLTLAAFALLAGWPAGSIAGDAPIQRSPNPSVSATPAPGSAEELFLQAIAAGSAGGLSTAAEQFRACLTAHPGFIPARRALDAIDDYEAGRVGSESVALVLAGQRLLHRQEWAAAERTLRQAVEQAPEYYQAWHDFGRALSERGLERQAVEAFQQALGLNPDYPYTHNAIGLSYAHLGQGERALDHFRRALEIDPRYYKVYNNLGAVLRSYGREEEAQAAFRQALALCPDYAVAEGNLAWRAPLAERAAGGRITKERSANEADETPTPRLVALLTSKRGETRTQAAERLVERRDPEAVLPVVRLLTHRRSAVRSVAARVLGAFPDTRTLAPLVKAATSDRDWMVRFEATGALGRLPDESTTATLMRTLSKDTDFHVRRQAATALCSRRGCRTLHALQAALRDRVTEVRDAAQGALACAGGRESSPDPAAWEEWIATVCASESDLE
jgi:tetratricopeptide (TPR) repeat protein